MISLIVAVSKNNVIGNNGTIPWKVKGEQQRFKSLTTGNTIIMGRKSFDEIKRPLQNRKTIIVSNTINIVEENCITVRTLSEALNFAKNEPEIFIAGGGQIYKEAMPYVDRIYLTVIDIEVDGDVYFPDFDKDKFIKTYEEKVEGEISYTYYTYEKI